MRLDQYLVQKGFETSRERAKRSIKNGLVKVNDTIQTKVSTVITEDDRVKVIDTALKRVSQGATKLEKMLLNFDLDLNYKKALDIGASTGGFTEVLLEQGVEKVISLDIGTDQLHSSLAANSRVISMEGTDFREIGSDALPFQPEVIVCDVSFISITEILRSIKEKWDGPLEFLGLIKPQFEMTERFKVKNGIIKNEKWRTQAINKTKLCATELGFKQNGEIIVAAGDGIQKNIEYGIHLSL